MMAKTQLNIRVGAPTRAKIDWLTERYGSQAQAVAVAVDRLYISEMLPWMRDHPGTAPRTPQQIHPIEEPMHIVVEFTEGSLFDSSGSEALIYVDMPTSCGQYAKALRATIQASYPNATIDVWQRDATDRITINGDTREVAEGAFETIDQLAANLRVWQSWSWLCEDLPADS